MIIFNQEIALAFSIVEFCDSEAATITLVYSFFFLPEEVCFTKVDNGVEATFLLLKLNIKPPHNLSNAYNFVYFLYSIIRFKIRFQAVDIAMVNPSATIVVFHQQINLNLSAKFFL